MSKITIALILSILFISCQQNKEQAQSSNPSENVMVDTVAVLNDPKNNLNIQVNSSSEIDSSGIIMFPLSMGESKRNKGKSYYKEMPYNSYWNIIFFNSNTSDYYLLSEKKMIINSIDKSQSSNDYPETRYRGKYIFYTITIDDFNNNGILDTNDPDYLFVTDKEGKSFRQISPANCHLKSWQFIASSNKVIMTVSKDTDKNKEFDNDDEVSSYQIDIDKESLPTEIFSEDFKNKLKLLYDKDWKRLK